MQLVFAGTPEFARQALQALLDAGHSIAGVLTQADRRSGRGMHLVPSPVKQLALAAEIPLCQPRGLRLDGRYPEDAASARQTLQEWQPDLMIVAAYGLVLPQWVLDIPRQGCLNIHASLLPRWRGAAPIQRAIQAGDAVTGISIMRMDAGLDTGPVLLQLECGLSADETAASLHDRLAELGARAIVQVLEEFRAGRSLLPVPQPASGVTYAEKLSRDESWLDFTQSAIELERQVRAFDPFPGCSMQLPGIDQPVKIWQAKALPNEIDDFQSGVKPATILRVAPQGIDLMTGDGVLRLLVLQRSGGRRQAVSSFVQGWSWRPADSV